MKKPAVGPSLRPSLAASPDYLVERWPTLADMLCATAYEGDMPGSRMVATLLLFAQEGLWKACLADRQENRCLWLSTLQFGELFTALEEALCSADTVWREDRNRGAEQARRQKPQNRG